MIIQDKVDVTIVGANKKYYESTLATKLSVGDVISVSIELLPSKSSIMIKCRCDECDRLFMQRIYRDHSVCGHCKTSDRMKGNNLGNKNEKYKIPEKNEIRELIESRKGKKYIADSFGVNINVLNRWLKFYDLEIRPFVGLKSIKNRDDEISIIENIEYFQGTKTKAEVIDELKITRSVLNTILKNNPDLKVKSMFDDWKTSREKIEKDLSFFIAENTKKSLKVIADEQDISIEQLKRTFRENNIKVKYHSYNKSKGELELRDFIRSLGKQCHSYMFNKKYEIDCFVQEDSFGIEYCGEYWHRFEPSKSNKNYHVEKHNFFISQGISLMTIFESEWQNANKRTILESMIKYRLKMTTVTKIDARKCQIKEISKNDANSFHQMNHISGKTQSTLNFGLIYGEELVCVLSLVKSRFDKNYEYEISRFSTRLTTIVNGGFSRLFKKFINTYDPVSCMTYADRRFGEGKVYLKNGFSFVSSSPPNYWYYDKNSCVLETRMKYQKSKLKKMFPTEFDDTLSEFENMSKIGYYKIYDCGSNKYVWNKK